MMAPVFLFVYSIHSRLDFGVSSWLEFTVLVIVMLPYMEFV